MWKLIKTEICYYKWLYIIATFVVITINFGLTMDNRWIEAQNDFPGLRIIWIGISIVVLFSTILFNRKSGRVRNNSILPLSYKQIALARVVPFILFWLTLSLVLVVFYFINNNSLPTNDWILNLISLTGIIFLINSIPILNTDFYSSFFSRRSRIILGILWTILWLAYIYLNSVFITYLDFILPELFKTNRAILTSLFLSGYTTAISIILGITLYLASIITFKKRKLYLE